MKKLLLLLLSNFSLSAMQDAMEQNKTPSHSILQQTTIQGHTIAIRYNHQEQSIFTQFIPGSPYKNTYLSKNMQSNTIYPRTRSTFYSHFQGREIFVDDELDEEKVALLKIALEEFENAVFQKK